MRRSTLKKMVLSPLLAASIAISGFFGFKRFDRMTRENAVKNSSLPSYLMTKKPIEEERYLVPGGVRGSPDTDTQVVIIDTAGAREFILECFANNPDYLQVFESQSTDRARDSLILNVVAKELDKKYVQVNSDNLDRLLYRKDTLLPKDVYGKDNACYTLSIAVAGVAHTLGIPSQLLYIYNIDNPWHAALALGGSCDGLVCDISGEEYGAPFIINRDAFEEYWANPPGLYQIRIQAKESSK